MCVVCGVCRVCRVYRLCVCVCVHVCGREWQETRRTLGAAGRKGPCVYYSLVSASHPAPSNTLHPRPSPSVENPDFISTLLKLVKAVVDSKSGAKRNGTRHGAFGSTTRAQPRFAKGAASKFDALVHQQERLESAVQANARAATSATIASLARDEAARVKGAGAGPAIFLEDRSLQDVDLPQQEIDGGDGAGDVFFSPRRSSYGDSSDDDDKTRGLVIVPGSQNMVAGFAGDDSPVSPTLLCSFTVPGHTPKTMMYRPRRVALHVACGA